ncbi:unnamed protein product [Parnassius apollo]|uniref:(apollo) hypothetical protein n=1 Tax=Parnassius apollo TaxID=110799 RepID=A0A8S3X7K3_PARAO|nr:unnamed protein product [Parnassius apollo]
MKFIAVFAAILAVAAGAQVSWTVTEVSAALQDPNTHPALIPFLEQALNEMMHAIDAGYPAHAVQVAVPVVSTWTLQELDAALNDPTTNPALIPYLEHALNEIMDAIVSGQDIAAVPVLIPAALAPVEAETPIMPVPVPAPIVIPGPSPAPVPAPVANPDLSPAPASSSPLVQIIININKQEQAASPAIQAPEITPTPVSVVEQAEDNSFNPVDFILPGGVAINPIVPEPVVGPIV